MEHFDILDLQMLVRQLTLISYLKSVFLDGEDNKHKFTCDPENPDNGTTYTEDEFRKKIGDDCYQKICNDLQNVQQNRVSIVPTLNYSL